MKLFQSRKTPAKGHEVHPDFPGNTGLHYRKVLNGIAARLNAEWYLEIGSRDGRSIAECTCNFIAVDPVFAVKYDVFNTARQMHFMQQTSDDFFASGFLGKNEIFPDFTFIDGMHHFEFALRDFMNAEKAMRPGGVIAFHDVGPYNYDMVTRDITHMTKLGRPWTGDVWKVLDILATYRPDLQIDLLSAATTGLGCVTGLDSANTVLDAKYDSIVAEYMDRELRAIGAAAYFDKVPPKDPEAYWRHFGPDIQSID